jgi:nicotinamidase/pyrazinamidase
MVPNISAAVRSWENLRSRNMQYINYGDTTDPNDRTEMYSAMRAEVADPRDPKTWINDELIRKLQIADKLLVCGQSLSHGIKCTVNGKEKTIKYELIMVVCVLLIQ